MADKFDRIRLRDLGAVADDRVEPGRQQAGQRRRPMKKGVKRLKTAV
jgi:hypothetical protein